MERSGLKFSAAVDMSAGKGRKTWLLSSITVKCSLHSSATELKFGEEWAQNARFAAQ